MTDPRLPLTGVPDVDAGHAADEASGLGSEVLRWLESSGWAQPRHIHNGRYARIYEAHARNGLKVAVQVQAPYALQRPKARHTLGNYLRLKLLPWLTPVHPNLVRYLSSGVLRLKIPETGRRLRLYYIVMPFIEGGTLQQALGDPAFRTGGLERLHGTILGILEGWSAIHARGLRQGDISPSNIILENGTWNPVLIDLRFSLRFAHKLIHEHRRFRSTLRAMLTGDWQNLRVFTPLSAEAVMAYWQSGRPDAESTRQLRAWMDFEAALGENGRLYLASPPKLLAAAREWASARTETGPVAYSVQGGRMMPR